MHFKPIKKIILLFIFFLAACPALYSINNNPSSTGNLLRIIYTVGNIDFVFKGSDTFGKSSLLYIMTLPKKSTFRREDLDLDMQRLKKFYFDNGFFDAVIDTSVIYSKEDETADITFTISEKKRYTLNKVVYGGLQNISLDIRKKLYNGQIIDSDDNYSRVQILAETSRVTDLLQDNGYPFAQLDTTNGTIVSKYLPSNKKLEYKVDVQLNFINVGKQYRFGKTKIIIAKNIYRLQEHLIERELTYKQGDLYDKENVQQSERNFSKLSIIQSGRIQIDSVLEDENRVNMIVNIILNNKYELTPNLIGVDIDNQFFVGADLEYSDRNFFGGGRVFSIAPQGLLHSASVNRAELNSTFYQPYFLNNRITATYNLRLGFYNIDQYLQVTSLRNLFRLNYFIAPYTFYNNAYSDLTLDLVRTKYKLDDIVDGDTVKEGTISNLLNSILGVTLIHNNTNDVFNPSNGFYHSFTVEDAGVIPRILSLINPNIQYSQYVKLFLLNKFYFDVTRGRAVSIFATDIKIGDIIEYGRGSNIVPVAAIYKFISGGSNSLRGWNAKENGILANPENGGNFQVEGSFEQRWKTFWQSETFLKNIWTVYFLDYGNVWEQDKYFRISQIALAIGLGVRYETFVGPIRVDFGFRLYDPNAETGKQWLFNKGTKTFKDKFSVQFGLGNAF